MTILRKMKKMLNEARRSKDKDRLAILSALIGEASIVGKNNGNRETTDSEALRVVQKFIKNLNEKVKLSGKETEKDKLEFLVYNEFMPKQLTREEIISILKENSFSNMGEAMRFFSKNYAGRYDGKELSLTVKENI